MSELVEGFTGMPSLIRSRKTPESVLPAGMTAFCPVGRASVTPLAAPFSPTRATTAGEAGVMWFHAPACPHAA